MKLSENQAGNRLDTQLIELIRTNLKAIRPEIDWDRIEFEADTTGTTIRLRSTDSTLREWLWQTITITQAETSQQVVVYPNAFAVGTRTNEEL